MGWRSVSWVGVVRWALLVAWWVVLVAAGCCERAWSWPGAGGRRRRCGAPGVRFRHPFAVQVEVVALGVLLVGLGAVFDVGARLQHDQDLTI